MEGVLRGYVRGGEVGGGGRDVGVGGGGARVLRILVWRAGSVKGEVGGGVRDRDVGEGG